jgi:electron transfer flavoprotein beta subunit
VKTIALIKQVPDISTVRFDAERGVIDRSSAQSEINPFDLNALEAAVRVARRTNGAVTAICMGPPSAESVLRDALSRGATDAALLTDPLFGGSDTIATARTLAQAIRVYGIPDLVVCGEKTVDGDTGQVGPELAELLDLPCAVSVEDISDVGEEEGTLTVISRVWEGRYRMRLRTPCLITVTKELGPPGAPTLRLKRRADKADIPRINAATLGLSPEEIGLRGSPTRVRRVVVPEPAGRRGQMFSGCTPESIEAAAAFVRERLSR